MKLNVDIIRMVPAHIMQAAAIEAEVFSVPWSARAFADALEADSAMFYSALVNGRVAGYCGIYLAADEGEITNVAVASAFRRNKIAESLLEKVLFQAYGKGARQIYLEVRQSNAPAQQLYQKIGFQVAGVRKNFYQYPVEDALVMVYGYADK